MRTEDREQMSEDRGQRAEVRKRKWEVGPVFVPEGRDYNAAKDAAGGKEGRWEDGKVRR